MPSDAPDTTRRTVAAAVAGVLIGAVAGACYASARLPDTVIILEDEYELVAWE